MSKIRLQKTGASVLETLSLTLSNPEGNELPRRPSELLKCQEASSIED